jgi:protein-disulfide isomerase-like protein with CxxC motif
MTSSQDFRRAEAWGVTGFPTLLAERLCRRVVLAHGYVSRAALQAME